MEALIPIAKSNRTGETVFIEEVSSGLNCDCRCIGCDVPLIAKKGEVNIHHFSHAPGKTNKDHTCPFSFERSVFLMIRLLLSKAKTISLPAYSIHLTDPCVALPCHYQVTHRSELIIDRVEFPKPSEKTRKVESAIIFRSGYPLALSFYLKKSSFILAHYQNTSPHPFKHQAKNIAHLAIDLSELQHLFRKKKCNYRLLLEKFLFESRLNKRWLYHPNEMAFRNTFYQQTKKLSFENSKPTKVERRNSKEKTQSLEQLNQRESTDKIPHVKHKKTIDEMKRNSKMRLSQLLQQVFEFKLQGNSQGYRCCDCYFMNTDKDKCQFCQCNHLELELLDEDYFDNIDHKYDCACFPIRSLKKLPAVEILMTGELINSA